MSQSSEFNFDGLIGPTHNYAGLSYGNVASTSHRNQPSNPKAAALQGLAKMKRIADLGVPQCVLPPLYRPRLEFLRRLGFTGAPNALIEAAYAADPVLLYACYSASNMWTANAATVSPSADCEDSRLHLTPANLSSTLHRSIEHVSTKRVLSSIFDDVERFCVHEALPSQRDLSDEGAANHTRFCTEHGQRGVELFVFGVDSFDAQATGPQKFPARQTRLASQAIARIHGLDLSDQGNSFFLQQNPAAIDAGVFHNDVIAVGNQTTLLCHERAFVDQSAALQRLSAQVERVTGQPLTLIEIATEELSLADAVASYFFNSQLVTRPDGKMTLVCPIECEEVASARRCTEQILAGENMIDQVLFLDLRQSMNNGGGPACLRLRVVLDEEQAAAIHDGVRLTDQLYEHLVNWVEEHYREQLTPADLRDPVLVNEVKRAFQALAPILSLPATVLMS